MRFWIFIILVSLYPIQVMARYIPKEFAHLYEVNELQFKLILPNDVQSRVTIEANYDGAIRAVDKMKVLGLIEKSGIDKKYTKDVLGAIFSDYPCKKKCTLVNVYFDYDTKLLEVRVSADLLDNDFVSNPYTRKKPGNQGVIISQTAFLNMYQSDVDLTYKNASTIGIGRGYIDTDLDLNIHSDSSDLDVNGISYNYEIQGHHFELGYNSYGQKNDNATSVLDNKSIEDDLYVSFSSSNNLLSKKKSSYKRLYFDMPNKGVVRFYRDGKIFKTNYYPAGQNSISYDELPRGNYTVVLKIKPDGLSELEIERKISNSNNNYSLNGYDYNVQIHDVKADDDRTSFLEGGYSIPVFDKVYGGLSIKAGERGNLFGSYLDYQDDEFGANVFIDYANDYEYFNLNTNAFGFTFDYSSSKNNAEDDDELSLAEIVYDEYSSENYALGYNAELWTGSLGLYANYWLRKSYNGGQTENSNFSLSYSKVIYRDWNMTLNMTKNMNDMSFSYYDQSNFVSEQNEDSISFSLRIPLTDKITSTSYYQDSSENGNSYIQTIETNELYGNDDGLNISGSISNTVDHLDSNTSLSLNAYKNSEKYNASSYFNIDSKSNINLSASIDNTVIIDNLAEGGVYTTSRESEAYVIVKSNQQEKDNGLINIRKDSTSSSTRDLDGELTVIPLDAFSTYSFDLDYESSGYKANESSDVVESLFTYPGTLGVMNSNLKKIISFVTYFEDFNEDSLNNIDCKGAGCVNITRVGDGIYSISIYEGYDYKIVSNNEFCLIDEDYLSENEGKSKCFPQVEEDDSSGLQIVKDGLGESDETIIYFGYVSKLPSTLLDEMRVQGIEPIQYEFGKGNMYLFGRVKDKNTISLNQLASLDTVQSIINYANNSDKFHQYSKVN